MNAAADAQRWFLRIADVTARISAWIRLARCDRASDRGQPRCKSGVRGSTVRTGTSTENAGASSASPPGRASPPSCKVAVISSTKTPTRRGGATRERGALGPGERSRMSCSGLLRLLRTQQARLKRVSVNRR